MKRADLVPPIFQAVAPSPQAAIKLFYETRETIDVIWPFVGVPQVIPALLGVVGVLKSHGIEQPERNQQRYSLLVV